MYGCITVCVIDLASTVIRTQCLVSCADCPAGSHPSCRQSAQFKLSHIHCCPNQRTHRDAPLRYYTGLSCIHTITTTTPMIVLCITVEFISLILFPRNVHFASLCCRLISDCSHHVMKAFSSHLFSPLQRKWYILQLLLLYATTKHNCNTLERRSEWVCCTFSDIKQFPSVCCLVCADNNASLKHIQNVNNVLFIISVHYKPKNEFYSFTIFIQYKMLQSAECASLSILTKNTKARTISSLLYNGLTVELEDRSRGHQNIKIHNFILSGPSISSKFIEIQTQFFDIHCHRMKCESSLLTKSKSTHYAEWSISE